MVKVLRLRSAILLIFSLLSCSFAVAAPAISSISPSAGPVSPVGSSVTINGSGFGTTQGSSTVTIGGIATTPTSWSDSRIVAPVPSALLPGFMDVIVMVGGTASNAASFLVIPAITAATPLSAPTGASVTIAGTSFGDSQGSSTVTFQNIPVTPSAWSNTSITLQIPDAAYDGPIVVTVNDFATNALPYTVTPTITGISPAAAPVGAQVTVSGTAFQPNQNFSPVTFNGVSATPVAWSNTSFTVSVPSGATTGPVVATVNNVASNGMPFIVTHPTSFYLTSTASTTSGLLQLRTWGEPRPAVSYPSVDLVNQPPGDYLIEAFDTPAGVPNSSDTWQSILPAFLAVFMKQTAGTPGTLFPKFELFLNGPSGTPICSATSPTALTTSQTSYSLSCTPSTDITVSSSDRYYLWVGVNSTATSTTSTQFQLTIGPGGGRGFGDVFLSVPIAAHIPTISGSDSQSYTAGAPFTITGSDFGTTTGTVSFNGETAVVSSWSDTSITALVPNDAFGRSSNITVFNANSVQSNPWGTTVVATINNLTPVSGGIGTSVVISGSGFGTSTGSVFFGGGTTGIVANWSDTSITATVPSGTITGSVYVLPADISAFLSNPFTFTVIPHPTITSVNPSTVGIGSTVLIAGTDFGVSQGTSTVAFNGIQATVNSWTNTTISAFVPPGATSGNVVVTVGGQVSNGLPFTIGGVLSGAFASTITAVTLTSSGAIDWAHWGTSDNVPLVTSIGMLPDFTVIGTHTPVRFSDGEIEYTWTDGDLVPAANRTSTGISVTGVGNGFHLSVPAGTTATTLLLYVGAWEAQGQLTASLSDNSANVFMDSSVDIVAANGDHHVNGTYTLTFQSSQPGQILNIDYVMAADHGAANNLAGYVSLQSALLLPAQPMVALNSPTDSQTFTYPSDVPLAASASQVGASISTVSFFSDSQKIFDATNSPYSFTLGGLAAGDHTISAIATDSNGVTSTSNAVTIAEVGTGGVLAGSVGSPVSVDLSAGTSDWAHWGSSIPDRKAGINPQISDFKTLANGSAHSIDAAPLGGVNYSWSSGTPTDSQIGTATQMRLQAYKNGFTLTIPADVTLRTLKLYVASGFGESTLRVSLSDGSAAPFVQAFSTPSNFSEKVYTIQFQAASAGQKITITDQVTRDDGFAYVALESASVLDQNVPRIDSVTPVTAVPGSQIIVAGNNFGGAQGNAVLSLNGVAMNVVSWTDSAITAIVPLVSSGSVVVSRGLANSNGLDFTVILPPSPVISFLSPSAGVAGTVVTVFGTNFGPSQNTSTVTFNGLTAAPSSWSDTQIVVPAPAGVHSGPVIVTTASGVSNSQQFTLAPGIRFSLQSAYVTPDEVNLEIGASTTFTLTGPSGAAITDANWTVDNPALAIISLDPSSPAIATLQTLAPGEVTITASSSLGNAQAIATIYPVGGTPSGTPAWIFYPQTQDNFFEVVVKSRSNSPSDPFIYFPEGTVDVPRVSALDEAGHLQWRVNLNPITPTDTISFPTVAPATNDGGILVQTVEADPNGPNEATAFYRLGPDGKPLWTYSVPTVSTSGPAIGPDGTIYFWEEPGSGIFLIALDDATGTGQPIFSPNGGTAPVFTSSEQPGSTNPDGSAVSPTNPWKPCADFFPPGQFNPPHPGNGGSFSFQPVVGADASVYVLEAQESTNFDYSNCTLSRIFYPPSNPPGPNDPLYTISTMSGQLQYSRTIQLVRLNSSGPVATTQIATTSYSGQASYSGGFTFNNGASQLPLVHFDKVTPNADGGAVVTWGRRSSTLGDPFKGFITNVVDDSAAPASPLPFDGAVDGFNGFGSIATNNQGTAFFDAFPSVSAIDIATGIPKWSVPGSLTAATDNGGAIVNNAGFLQAADQNGTVGSDSLFVGRSANYLAPGKFFQFVSFGSVGILPTDSAQLATTLANPWPIASNADPQETNSGHGFTAKKRITLDDNTTQDVQLQGIANSRTSSIVVNLSVGNKSVTLTLSSGGTGKAVFDDGTTQGANTVSIPPNTKQQIVKIKGLAASQKVDDITLAASTSNGVSLGMQRFSVVSVSLHINVSGTISADNSTRSAYIQFSGVGSDHIGNVVIPFSAGNLSGCRNAVEIVGKVTPTQYKGTVVLRRNLLEGSDWGESTFIAPLVAGPDTSFPENRDDDPQPDGNVYDVDLPGLRKARTFYGLTRRLRQNFSSFAVLDSDSNAERVSDLFSWYSRESCHVAPSGPQFLNDVPGDNQAGEGCTKLSLDLQSTDHAGTVCSQ